MSEATDIISAIAVSISAAATTVAAVGVWFARKQLKTSREIAQLQFEDALAKEYRDLANRLKPKTLLGETLNEAEYQEAFDELFHYIDLSNEQVCLRQRRRISAEVWLDWAEGIQSNLALPAFSRAWNEIQLKSNSFQELRRFSKEGVNSDPAGWR